MWISPKFHLQVIRAYDQMVTAAPVQTFQVPQTMGQALALAAQQWELAEAATAKAFTN